jgi:hypothetical protein
MVESRVATLVASPRSCVEVVRCRGDVVMIVIVIDIVVGIGQHRPRKFQTLQIIQILFLVNI